MNETYCPACGMGVLPRLDTSGGARVWRCSQCGLGLKTEGGAPAPGVLGRMPVAKVPASQVAKKPAQSGDVLPWGDAKKLSAEERLELVDLGAAREPEPEPIVAGTVLAGTLFDRVILADDSAMLRAMLEDALTSQSVAREVVACENGEKLLEEGTRRMRADEAFDLVVCDIEMPSLSGYHAAIAWRAVERAFGRAPAPFLFFTARVADETLQKVLEYCQPARYLNKGADGARIAERLVQVVSTLKT